MKGLGTGIREFKEASRETNATSIAPKEVAQSSFITQSQLPKE